MSGVAALLMKHGPRHLPTHLSNAWRILVLRRAAFLVAANWRLMRRIAKQARTREYRG